MGGVMRSWEKKVGAVKKWNPNKQQESLRERDSVGGGQSHASRANPQGEEEGMMRVTREPRRRRLMRETCSSPPAACLYHPLLTSTPQHPQPPPSHTCCLCFTASHVQAVPALPSGRGIGRRRSHAPSHDAGGDRDGASGSQR